MRAREIMSKVLFYCTPEETTERAAQLMREHDIGAVPVVNDCTERKLVGVLTDRDICIKVAAAGKSANAVRVADVMTRWPVTCSPEDPIEACEEIMRQRQVRRVPVIDARGVCIGMVSQADVALHDTADHTQRMLAAISQHVWAAHGNSESIH
jgi:CBS domain-containing protein